MVSLIKINEQLLKTNRIVETAIKPFPKVAITLSTELENALKSYAKIYIDYSEKIRPVMENFQSLLRDIDFTKLRQGLLETEEDLKVFKALMVSVGFPPHYSMEISEMRQIANEYMKDKDVIDKEAIEEFMCLYYTEEILGEIAYQWEFNLLLKDRIQILRTSLRAHNLKMYEVSIPAMLAQLEGVLMDTFHIKGKSEGEIIKILLNELFFEDSNQTFSFDSEIKNLYENHVLVGFKHGNTIGSDISRHAILHGGDKYYANQSNSLKIILLFDHISDASKRITQEKRKSAKKKVQRYRYRKNKK